MLAKKSSKDRGIANDSQLLHVDVAGGSAASDNLADLSDRCLVHIQPLEDFSHFGGALARRRVFRAAGGMGNLQEQGRGEDHLRIASFPRDEPLGVAENAQGCGEACRLRLALFPDGLNQPARQRLLLSPARQPGLRDQSQALL